jgi:hypothetical protein
MPSHACIDPYDPYAQAEVLVDFEVMASGVRLIAVRDAWDHDTLPELDEPQRKALETEILDDYRQHAPSTDGPPRRGAIMGSPGTGTGTGTA